MLTRLQLQQPNAACSSDHSECSAFGPAATDLTIIEPLRCALPVHFAYFFRSSNPLAAAADSQRTESEQHCKQVGQAGTYATANKKPPLSRGLL